MNIHNNGTKNYNVKMLNTRLCTWQKRLKENRMQMLVRQNLLGKGTKLKRTKWIIHRVVQ